MISKLLTLVENLRIEVTSDTQYILNFKNLHNDAPYNVTFDFIKPDVTAEILGFYSLDNSQRLVFSTITNHLVPNTSCITKIRGVLNGNALSSYIGKIIIAKNAQQTSSFLNHNVLVTGNTTHNNSQPILEIDADDVKASHAATTGRIDENQVYYLMSRGLSRRESQEIIIQGFFDAEITNIKDKEIIEEISSGLYKGV